jgi:hypothetical protein
VLTATAVSSVTVVAGGYYTATPTIAPSSGAATFTAVLATTPGPITSVTVGGGGSYTANFPPALTITRHASDTGWADQTDETAGLVTLADETLATVGDVVTVARAYAYRDLADLRAPGQTVAEWMAKSEQWEAKAVRRLAKRPRDPLSGIPNLSPVRSYAGRYR